MQDEFDSKLQAGFEDAHAARERSKAVGDLSRKQPEELAVRVVYAIVGEMEELREEVARERGVDIADLGGLADAGLGWRGLSEEILLINKINLFNSSAELLQKLAEYADDPSRSREDLIAKACETALESLEASEASKLHSLREIRLFAEEHLSEEAAREAKDAEARYLAGHLTTRISPNTNRRLAKALDEIREHKKPRSREWFEVLLRELYVVAPGAWDEHHRTDWRLRATRNAVVKKIEQRLLSSPATPAEEDELAAFVSEERKARKRLLKWGREARLAPREYEIFELFVNNPELKYREVADKLGVSVGTVGKTMARVREVRRRTG